MTDKKDVYTGLDDAALTGYTEPDNGLRYDNQGMIAEFKRLGRPLTDQEAEKFRFGTPVKSLFLHADIDKIILAYHLLAEQSLEMQHAPVREKIERLETIDNAIRCTVSLFAECTPEDLENPQTIFVMEFKYGNWDNRGETEFHCFSISDAEAIEKLNAVEDIERYGIYMEPIETLSGMRLAWTSHEEYGAEACCALILNELFWFGLTPKIRKKNIESFCKGLDRAMEEIENEETVEFSADELWQHGIEMCDTEDEREHMMLERGFHEAVKEIEDRHFAEVHEQNEKKFRDTLKREYAGLFRSREYDLQAYMRMPHRLEIVENVEEGGYTAAFPELPGCLTCAETLSDVLKLAIDAKWVWLEDMLERGMRVAETTPVEDDSILYIGFATVNKDIAEKAEREGFNPFKSLDGCAEVADGPNISPDFTIDDIHNIREYDFEMTKGMSAEEANEYFKVGADRTMAEIEQIRKENLAHNRNTQDPDTDREE